MQSPDQSSEPVDQSQVEEGLIVAEPVNVAVLVDDDYLSRFGSVFGHSLIGLVDQPINVTVVCPEPRALSDLPTGPATIVQYRSNLWPSSRREHLRRLAETLEKTSVNLIHSFCGRQSDLACRLAGELDLPYVVSVTGLLQRECLWRVDPQRCRALIAISEPIRQALVETYDTLADRIHLVRPGCFCRNVSDTADVDRPRAIVSAGDFDSRSGFDLLLRALGRLAERDVDYLAFLFGTGSFEPTLRRWVRTARLGSRITFLPPIAQWYNVLNDADVYVQPGALYQLHGGPYEALSRGCPIVSTPDTAFDLVVDGETGRTFPAGDEDALADILTSWLSGCDDILTDLAQRTSRFAKDQLSLPRSIDKMIAIYRTALDYAVS